MGLAFLKDASDFVKESVKYLTNYPVIGGWFILKCYAEEDRRRR
jgi:hypothetical protein